MTSNDKIKNRNFAQVEPLNVTLPAELEQLVQEKVARGEFDSVDAALADGFRHISHVFAEIMADVPPHVLAKLPKDGASQVDHYVYGLPKRDE